MIFNKKIFMFFLFLFNMIYAESNHNLKTKLEHFQATSGTILIKGYSYIGEVYGMGKISIDVIEFINANNQTKQKGLRIEVTESGNYERSNVSFIDYDEIGSLLKGINYISKANKKIIDLEEFEATYKTKGNFKITTFSSSNGRISVAVSSGYIPRTAFISLEKLEELKNIIIKGKQKLDSIK